MAFSGQGGTRFADGVFHANNARNGGRFTPIPVHGSGATPAPTLREQSAKVVEIVVDKVN